MNMEHALHYDAQSHVGTLLTRRSLVDMDRKPTDLKAKEPAFL